MTAALFPVAVLIVFVIMLAAFCYEPKSETDSPLFAGASPYLSRAQQIDRAIEIELHALRYPYLVNRVYARNARVNTIGAGS